MSYYKPNFSHISDQEVGYLGGLYLGDGYSYHDAKQRHYAVEFYLNSLRDKETRTLLLSLTKKIGLNAIVMKDKRFNCLRLRFYSKDFMSWLENMSFIPPKNRNFAKGVISGLIDSDGYVNKEKSYIQIVNTNLEVMNILKLCLIPLGLDTEIRVRSRSRKDKLKSYKAYIPFIIKDKDLMSTKVRRVQTLSGD